MSLTAKDIETIMRLIEESAFDELTLEMEGLKLSLRRGTGAAPATAGDSAAPATPAVQAVAASAPAPAAPAAPVPEASGPDAAAQAITAPMLGTFYRAPKPGAPPFVEVGSVVEADSVIGIIEVMKLMNAVRAGRSGRIRTIAAKDGQLVEYGEILMQLEEPG